MNSTTADSSKYELLVAAIAMTEPLPEIPEPDKKMYFKPKRSMKVKNKRNRKRKR